MSEFNTMSLFDFIVEPVKQTVTINATNNKNEEIPSEITKVRNSKTLEEFIQNINEPKDKLFKQETFIQYNNYFIHTLLQVIGNHVIDYIEEDRANDVCQISTDYYGVEQTSKTNVVYFSQDGTAWYVTTTITLSDKLRIGYPDKRLQKPIQCRSIEFSKPRKLLKLVDFNNELDGWFLMNKEEELWEILKNSNPYAYDYAYNYYGYERNDGAPLLLLAPQIEQLGKAGYSFIDNVLSSRRTEKNIEIFNRLTKQGNNLKEIFKTPKIVYETLKEDTSLETWDIYRKMEKQGKLSKDTLVQAYESNYTEADMKEISSILNKTYNGKPVFTWDTLQNYLRRIDMFQAIGKQEAFILLNDYLTMCQRLEVEPRIDSDSLKREHDITARTLREKQDELKAKEMEGACDYLKANDYTENVYMIRGVRSYADLIDEAKQQHNCVAGYADSIIKKRSLIYVMRRTDEPDKSLITVEINPEQNQIRQKFLAYNQRIHNKSQTEFLERWISKVRQRNASGAEHII